MAHQHDEEAVGVQELGTAFKWAIGLNVGYVVIEAAAGFVTGSLALLADAAHNLTDVAGLLIAWGATVVAARSPTQRFTYGLGRSTQLAALANAVAILIGVGMVVWEALQRLTEPTPVPAGTVLVVALVGIAVNGGTALLFSKSRHADLNAEGAFLHMASDAAVSLGVVLAAAGILFTGWMWLDPLTAIAVSIVIAWTAFALFRSALRMTLDAVPSSIDRSAVECWLAGQPGVAAVHDLHIWPLSTTRTALTVHLILPGGHPGDDFLHRIQDELEHRFHIQHATLQIELGDASICRLAPEDVV